MKKFSTAFLLVILSFASPLAFSGDREANQLRWVPGTDKASFWNDYVKAKGGLTFPKSTTYPEYSKVKEGDTFLVETENGICLMEFFHRRWRRANDVRRWHPSFNQYSACPTVFD